MTLAELKTPFLSLSEPAQLELILKIRKSRTEFKQNSQTKTAKAKVSTQKREKKATSKTLAGLTLQEKLKLLEELQSEKQGLSA